MLNPKVVRDFWTFLAIFSIVGASYAVSGIVFGIIVGVCVTVVQIASARCVEAEAQITKAETNNKKRK